MALWRYTLELPDGRRISNLVRSGTRDGAVARVERIAERRNGELVEGPERASGNE